jgi:hypothetical protein
MANIDFSANAAVLRSMPNGTAKTDIILRLVSLDTPLSSQELAHTWVSDAVDWFDIDGMLPKYEKGVPRHQ